MNLATVQDKIVRRLRQGFLGAFSRAPFYPWLYACRWHLALAGPSKPGTGHFLTSVANAGAGIGHQLANILAGYVLAERLGLTYAHSPLPGREWEDFFGLGADMPEAPAIASSGLRTVQLPLFDAADPSALRLIRDITASYSGKPVLFQTEQDQFEFALDASAIWFKRQFYKVHAASRSAHRSDGRLNVALHVRRGDIGATQDLSNPNLTMRWNSDRYFLNLIDRLASSDFGSRMDFNVYSQGDPSAFAEFSARPNAHLHLDTDLAETFLSLATADVLVTSRSSLSYKAALLNEGLKICPDAFWHGYPDGSDWLVGSDPDGVPLETLDDRLKRLSVADVR